MRTSAILGSALLCLSMSADATAAERSSVSLQVRSTFHGYRAQDVQEFLSDPGYLGSIHSSLAPANGTPKEVPAGMVHVNARTPADEVVTVQMVGGEGSDVAGAMDAVLEHLLGITPSSFEEAEQSLEYASKRLASAEEAFEVARVRRLDYVDRNGATDPSDALSRLVHSLTMYRSELDQSRSQWSGEEALRDYLIHMIGSSGMTDSEREILAKDLRDVRAKYEEMEATRSSKHPQLVQLAGQIEKITVALEGAVVSEAAKAHREQMEVELFSVERKLAIARSRIEQYEGRLAEVEIEAKELSRVENSWQEIERSYREADSRLRSARDQLRIAEQQYGPISSTPWLRVLAGPTRSDL